MTRNRGFNSITLWFEFRKYLRHQFGDVAACRPDRPLTPLVSGNARFLGRALFSAKESALFATYMLPLDFKVAIEYYQ